MRLKIQIWAVHHLGFRRFLQSLQCLKCPFPVIRVNVVSFKLTILPTDAQHCLWLCFQLACPLNSSFLMVMKNVWNSWNEGFDQRKGFQCGYTMCLSRDVVEKWNQCESVPLVHWTGINHCLPRTTTTTTTFIQVIKGDKCDELNCLPGVCVCVSVSACVMTVASAVTSLMSDVLPGVKTENQ